MTKKKKNFMSRRSKLTKNYYKNGQQKSNYDKILEKSF